MCSALAKQRLKHIKSNFSLSCGFAYMCSLHKADERTNYFFVGRAGGDFVLPPSIIFLQTTIFDEPPLPRKKHESVDLLRRAKKNTPEKAKKACSPNHLDQNVRNQVNQNSIKYTCKIGTGIGHRRLIETATEQFLFFPPLSISLSPLFVCSALFPIEMCIL